MGAAIQQAIAQLLERHDLDTALMTAAMHEVMSGTATPAQVGGFLVALRMKGESVTEITAAARVMRELATPVQVECKHLVDTCGTGGDGKGLFNISTAAAFVVACAGGHVAKHGNRSVSSSTGSADLLEAAGVRLDLGPQQVGRCISEMGVGFLFAVNHHAAMKHAIGPRRELGVRTIFNLLGPLTNPAAAPNQVLGVYHDKWVRPLAEVLQALGGEHVLVVHAEDGLDEISIAAPTHVAELRDGVINEYMINPEQFGLEYQPLDSLQARDANASLELVKIALTENKSAAADIVALNAGAAIYAANLCRTLGQGVDMARDVIGSKLAWEKLQDLAVFSANIQD